MFWPGLGDQGAARRALSLGAITSVIASAVVLTLAVITLTREITDPSTALIGLLGGLGLLVAATLLYRAAPIGAVIAISIWLILGILPAGIPMGTGVIVLLALLPAARGAYVLGKLKRDPA